MAKRFDLKQSIRQKTSENPAAAEVEREATGEPETKRLNVNVPAPLYSRLKTRAESEGRSLTWLITQWIEAYVDRELMD